MVSVVIAMATASYAQTKKGNIVLSGGTELQFNSSNEKYIYNGETGSEYKMSSLSLSPSFAYFLADNLAIGLTGTIEFTTNKHQGGDKYVSNSSTILPTVSYYFPVEGKIRPIVHIAAGLFSQRTRYIPISSSDITTSRSGFAFNLGGGIAYFIKENISIDFGLSYTSYKLSGSANVENKQTKFGSDIGLSIYF